MSIIRSKSSGLTVPLVPSCTTTSSPSWPVSRYCWQLVDPGRELPALLGVDRAPGRRRWCPGARWAAPSITESPTAVTSGHRQPAAQPARWRSHRWSPGRPWWSGLGAARSGTGAGRRRGAAVVVVLGLSTDVAAWAGHDPRGPRGRARRPRSRRRSRGPRPRVRSPATANAVPSWRRRSPFDARNSRHRRPSAPWRIGSSTYLYDSAAKTKVSAEPEHEQRDAGERDVGVRARDHEDRPVPQVDAVRAHADPHQRPGARTPSATGVTPGCTVAAISNAANSASTRKPPRYIQLSNSPALRKNHTTPTTPDDRHDVEHERRALRGVCG